MLPRVLLSLVLTVAAKAVFAQDSSSVAARARPDTVYAIGEVVVTAARRAGSIFEAPLAMSVLERKELRRLRGVGVEEALTGVPGVLAQPRSGTQDVRLTIRGFGARAAGERSNSGTSRGVRVLLDGIPMTEPDGRTSFDLIDVSTAGRVEVVRSNATAVWGNAAGGVVNILSNTWFERPYVDLHSSAGSFGFRKLLLQTGTFVGPGRFFLSLGHFSSDGWRAQSAAERTLLHTGLESALSDATRFGLYLTAASNAFQIPGALTPLQFSQDPRRAQDDTLAYDPTYIERNERRLSRLFRLGFTLSHDIGPKHSVSVMAFAVPKFLQRSERNTFRDFTRYHIGGGLLYRNTIQLGDHAANILQAGLDLALQDGAVLFHALESGERGQLETDKREGAFTGGVFLMDELMLNDRWSVVLGARYDRITYTYESYYEADPSTPLLRDRKDFSRLTPKAGITYRFSAAHSLYANLGGGLEVPAGNETNPPAVGGADTLYAINPLLEASSSTTIELGTKQILSFDGNGWIRSFSYDLALYCIDVANDFIPYRGGRFYFTAGKTHRVGAEAGLSAEFAGAFSALASLTVSRSTYVDYTVDSVHYGRPGSMADLSGNASAGIPDLHYTARLRYAPPAMMGLYLELSMEGIDRYYADDYNRFAVPPFTVWHLAAGLDDISWGNSPLGARLGFSLRNAGDRTYVASGWVNPDLDARGDPIYLEPGLPRTFVIALGLRWRF